ncbi:FAD-dependent oxidoreductase [Nakamurella leprariae]|uniref:FAD-dependent oxidoreductase n=1 Tax=Nakamurella leprariae TaxID=2803911 RepID=A0A938YDV1_9ACTN|nr:FAD-dependent oxidoreductase [Nakamurella leprariae]MBM9468004.1 FAD-dependent oxidoreductase [Nakamurella leprariae]
MRSLWLDTDRPDHRAEVSGQHCDIAVVGAGLTGLTAAVLFARAGASVAVLEARSVGAGATGNTTAKISVLQGARLASIAARQPTERLQQYVEANREGQAWLLHYCREHGIDHQIRDDHSYASTPRGRKTVDSVLSAAQQAGLPVEPVDELELPYPTHGAVRLREQAQFDPMPALDTLARELLDRGGLLAEGTRVREVGWRSPATIRTSAGTLTADRVVLATGTPILDRGGFFARLEPLRSYALAFRTPAAIPSGMYLSVDQPTRSLRSVPAADGSELLLVGGNGHVVGRDGSTQTLVDDLTEWTARWFPGSQRTHAWSAQDYRPIDELPYVGPLMPGNERILVATGFDKWGMTNAVAAALALSGAVLGGSMPWARALRSWDPHEVRGVPSGTLLNAKVGARMATDWLRPRPAAGKDDPAEGTGRIERDGVKPIAACTVDGVTHRRSAVCPHMHGIVNWNSAEQTWDCPLHGARYTATGRVLEGPVTNDLSPA